MELVLFAAVVPGPPGLARPARARGGGNAGVILEVDPASAVPPYEQVRQGVKALVLGGALQPGARLPSIRQLTDESGWRGAPWRAPTGSSRPTGS